MAERLAADLEDTARITPTIEPRHPGALDIGPQRSAAVGISPRSVFQPPARDGGLPGLGQYFSTWGAGNDYQACGQTGVCLQIDRANFNYSYSSLLLNVLQVPNLIDTDGNRPANALTLIGAVRSGSYLQFQNAQYYGGNNSASCAVLGVACTWQTHAAQNFQVLIGDGAYANGSNTVVIGTNARHALPVESWAGAGGPDTNYASRLGHSVVVGHGATGSADRQTILGADASSTHLNSVALGAGATTVRGPQASYVAPGLESAQVSAGEVSVGAVGAHRQITHVAAGSADTDAVNVGQMQGAIAEVNAGNLLAVTYADAARDNVALSAAGTTISNLAAGTLSSTSTQAVNGAQLHGLGVSVASALGAGADFTADGSLTAPAYSLQGGTVTATSVGAVVTNLDDRTTANTRDITRFLSGSAGLVQQDPATLAVSVASATDGAVVGFANASGNARTLTGVDAGRVAADSTQAINGAQLFNASASIATHLGGGAAVNADGSLSGPTYTIRGTDVQGMGAAFAAVDGLLGDATALGAFAVRYEEAAGKPDLGRITLGDRVTPTSIGNLAAGIAADEAVNVAQLSPVLAALGGGAGMDAATGALILPTYALDDGSGTGASRQFADVGAALGNLDGRVVGNRADIDTLLDGTAGLVQQAGATGTVTVGASTGGLRVDLGNVDGNARVLGGVADGALDADAINMGQLRRVQGQITNLDALAVQYDDATRSAITLAGGAGTTLSGVAIGTVAVDSTQAINGAQLFGTAHSVATYLGGGAAINADGTVSAPAYAIRGGTFDTVGAAFDAVENAFAGMGDGVDALTAFAVRYDDDAGAPDLSRITLAGPAGTTLANVAAGVANDEAVNVAQLAPVVSALGGGAGIDPVTGVVIGPTYTLDDGSHTGTTIRVDNLGSALANLDGRTLTNTNEIAGLLSGTAGLVRQDPTTLVIGVANEVAGTQVDFANRAGEARRLSGVATGTVDTDAVNLAQLRNALVDVNADSVFAVRYDQNASGAPDRGRITLGGGAAGTTITNVAAGALSAASTEAIHGGQLFATHTAIAELLGGGASLTPLGMLVAPGYAIQGAFYSSIGSALAALNSGLDAINRRIDGLPPPVGQDVLVGVDGPREGAAETTVTEGSRGVAIGASAVSDGHQAIAVGSGSAAVGDNTTVVGGNARVSAANGTAVGANATIEATAPGAVAVGEGARITAAGGVAVGQGAQVHASSSVALGQGSVADRANTVSVGSVGGERQLTHVAAGTSGTDAVNVNQMNAGIERALRSANDYTDARLHQMQSDIWEIDRGYRAGVASALAVAGLPQAYQPGRSMVAAAVSGYEQEAGIAVGITTISESGRWVYKFSGTTNTRNDVGVTMGAGMQW